jgi:hypothetical protein
MIRGVLDGDDTHWQAAMKWVGRIKGWKKGEGRTSRPKLQTAPNFGCPAADFWRLTGIETRSGWAHPNFAVLIHNTITVFS